MRGGHPDDEVAVIAAGITVHEAIAAADELKGTIQARVVDACSVKPIDSGAVLDAVRTTGGRLYVVEDHRAEGGLGEAVLAAPAEAGGSEPLETSFGGLFLRMRRKETRTPHPLHHSE